MSTKKHKQQTTSRENKRERFAEPEGGKPRGASPLILIAGIAVALFLIGGTVFALTRPSPGSTETVAAAAAPGLDFRQMAHCIPASFQQRATT